MAPVPLLHSIAVELRDAVVAELTAAGLEMPQRIEVVHGEVVWDECQCGLLWVRWISAGLTDAFPGPVEGAVHCSALTAMATFEVGLLRCVPTVTVLSQNKVKLPSATELEVSALELATDAALLLRAVLCVARSWGKGRRYVIGDLSPASTDGGCAGSTIGVTTELTSV